MKTLTNRQRVKMIPKRKTMPNVKRSQEQSHVKSVKDERLSSLACRISNINLIMFKYK